MSVRARKIKSVVLADGEVVEGNDLEKLLADPARPFEYPDPTPMAPPIGYQAGPSLIDQMRMMVRTELSKIAEDNNHETFADAEDFDVDDDYDPSSPWEQEFDPEDLDKMHPDEALAALADAAKSGVSGDKSPDAKPSPEAPQEPPAKPAS